jgi:AraC family transcriptional regulator of adaptative response / DNA-3-methyladenine glycosylase II
MLTQHECEQARLARDPRFDGLFFILVKTTKIFCRNICKVRMPLEKNVEYAVSAQQALSKGYRPCLRCRPDSAPNSSAWQGVNTTVNRAITLLTQRLNDSIESIADSLGISTRYLNKLFQEHMQISAKRYRIYQQVLMAKRLLQETNLPVEKVAESVGFASARQLQQHVKTYLRLTPIQLRNASVMNNMKASKKVSEKNSVEPALSENISMLLAYRPPYNWPQVRDFFAKRQIDGNEAVHKDGFVKIVSIYAADNDSKPNQDSSKMIAVSVKVLHIAEKKGFKITFNAAYSAHTLAIMSIIKRMLDIDACPQLIEKALLQAGLTQQELVKGLRIPGVASEFEAGCRAVLGQQVSVAAAVNKVNHLHAYFASQSDKANKNIETHFPSPKMVANSDLLFLKIPGARRQTLIDLAHYYYDLEQNREPVAKKVDISSSIPEKRLSDEQALLGIKGIGPWTVNYIGLRAKGDTDIWLSTDLVIKQQVAKLEQSERHLKADLAMPWRSYLTLNLWSMSS